MTGSPRPARGRPWLLTGRHVSTAALGGLLLILTLIGIAWRSTNALWFLTFPLILAGILIGGAMAVLWGLRHF